MQHYIQLPTNPHTRLSLPPTFNESILDYTNEQVSNDNVLEIFASHGAEIDRLIQKERELNIYERPGFYENDNNPHLIV